MASPTGRGEHIPMAIFRGVSEHARRMGYPVASDDLFLLAVAELAEGTPARDVLESAGISAERLATEISSRALPMPRRIEWSAVPARVQLDGREGRSIRCFTWGRPNQSGACPHGTHLGSNQPVVTAPLAARRQPGRRHRRAPLVRRGRPAVDPASGRGRDWREDLDRPGGSSARDHRTAEEAPSGGALRLQLRRRQGVGSR